MRESIEVGSVGKGVTPSKVLSLKQLSARALAIKHFRELMEETMQPSSGVDTPISRALSFFRSFPEIKSRGYGIDKFVTQLVIEMHQDVAKELYHACMQIEGITESKPGSLSDEIKQQLKLIFEQYTGHKYPEDFLGRVLAVFLKRHQLIKEAETCFRVCGLEENKFTEFLESIPVYGNLVSMKNLQNALLSEAASLQTLKLAIQQDQNGVVDNQVFDGKIFHWFAMACWYDMPQLFQGLCVMIDDNPTSQLYVLKSCFRCNTLMQVAVQRGSKFCLVQLVELWGNLLEANLGEVCHFHDQLRYALYELCDLENGECLSLLLQVCLAQVNVLQAGSPAESFWDLPPLLSGTRRGAISLIDLLSQLYVKEAVWSEVVRRCLDQFLRENVLVETDIQMFVACVKRCFMRGGMIDRGYPEHEKIIDELQETLSAPQYSDDPAATDYSPGPKI